MRFRTVSLFLVVPVFGLLLLPAQSLAVSLERASVAYDGTQANGGSDYRVSVSANGRFVAFVAAASNLVPGDSNYYGDVFVKDRQTGAVERVNVGGAGQEAHGLSSSPSLSADGRYVGFESEAPDLIAGDTNVSWDVFVKDRQTGSVERISVSGGGVEADAHSGGPSLSGDGRYVAFWSVASNLVRGDTNGTDVFLKDRQTGSIQRMNLAADGTQANNHAFAPSISADGRYVAFYSSASNLVPGDTNGVADVFIKDSQTLDIERVSVGADGRQGNGSSRSPSLSADGRFVAFESDAANLLRGDNNEAGDIFVKDLSTGEIERISLTADWFEANGGSSWPSLSRDGRYVAFISSASNLVPGDNNGCVDVFVRDRQTGAIRRISESADGTEENGVSLNPSVSDTGVVAFVSDASNLVPGDTNGAADVFVGYFVPANFRTLQVGWNLLAGGPDSEVRGVTGLFWFDGASYRSTTAVEFVAGKGYWARATAPTTAALASLRENLPGPLPIPLLPGWNLIGNVARTPASLPPGRVAFVFDGTRYLSQTTLDPGVGSWIRASVAEEILLDPGVGS